MRRPSLLFIASLLVGAPVLAAATQPVAPIETVTDTYFGKAVPDPYRWMEKGTADPRFLPYLKSQSAYMQSVLARLSTQRERLHARLSQLSSDVARISGWQQAGGKLFFLELDPSVSTAVLRVRDATGVTRTLIDPSHFAKARSHVSIDYYRPSQDGSYVA